MGYISTKEHNILYYIVFEYLILKIRFTEFKKFLATVHWREMTVILYVIA